MRFTFTECPTVVRSAVTLEKRIFLLVVTSSAVLTDHIVARVLKKTQGQQRVTCYIAQVSAGL